jgi:polyferredoxin
VALFIRSDIDVTVAPVRNPQFVTLSDGSIRNTYDVRIRNMTHQPTDFAITLVSDQPLAVELEGRRARFGQRARRQHAVAAGLCHRAPGQRRGGCNLTNFRFWVEDLSTTTRTYQDTTFFGRDLE